MRALFLCSAFVLALTACGKPDRPDIRRTLAPPSDLLSTIGTAELIVHDTTSDIIAACGATATACALKYSSGKYEIHMPNPCLYRSESYALTLCHERAHVIQAMRDQDMNHIGFK